MPIIQFVKKKQKPSGKYWTPGDRMNVTVERADELCDAGDAKLVKRLRGGQQVKAEAEKDSEQKSKTKN